MKRVLVLLIALAATIGSSYAQQYPTQKGDHLVRTGVGILGIGELIDLFVEIASESFIDYDKMVPSGGLRSNIFGTYQYHISRTVRVGGTIAHNSFKYDVFNDQEAQIGTNRCKYFALAVEGDVAYWSKGAFMLYGSLGAGLYMANSVNEEQNGSKDTTNSFSYAFQISPICMQYGRDWGLFIEGGVPFVGYKGMVSVGLFAKF